MSSNQAETDGRGGRFAVFAAVGVAAALVAVGMLLSTGAPGPDTSPAEVTRHFADDAVENRAVVAVGLIAVAAVLLLWLLGWLRETVRRAGSERTASIVLASGAVFVALSVAAVVVDAAISHADGFDAYHVDPSTALLFEQLSFEFHVFADIAAAVLIAATSTASLRAELLPRWLGRGGQAWAVLTALAAIAGAGDLPLLVWLVATTAVLSRRTAASKVDTTPPLSEGAAA